MVFIKCSTKITKNFIYLTIGDGPEQENLHEIQTRLPCRDRIFIFGRQTDEFLKHAYKASDLFIMPNINVEGDMEGFGIVIMEANLTCTPVIASNFEGIKDVIKDGVNGYLLETENSESFLYRIKSLAENEEELNSLRTSSREYVEKLYNWDRISSQYIEYIE